MVPGRRHLRMLRQHRAPAVAGPAPGLHDDDPALAQGGHSRTRDLQGYRNGYPAGGIVTPLLANVALDGLERLFDGPRKGSGRAKARSPSKKAAPNTGITLVRVADDFVVPRGRRWNPMSCPRSRPF